MIPESELQLINKRLRIVSFSTLGDRKLENYPYTLRNMAKGLKSSWLIIDGLDKLVKDAATTDSGTALEAGITYAVEAGINIVATTHLKKDQREKSYTGSSIGDIYGTSKIANVFGSIITLSSGEAGDQIVQFKQLKNVVGTNPVVGSVRHNHHEHKSFFVKGDLLGAIRDLGGSATVPMLDEVMNSHANTIRKDLSVQESSGMVFKEKGSGGTGTGSIAPVWHLTDLAIHTHFPQDLESSSQSTSQAVTEFLPPQLNGALSTSHAVHNGGF